MNSRKYRSVIQLKKTLKSIVLLALSANVILSSVAPVVGAAEGEPNPPVVQSEPDPAADPNQNPDPNPNTNPEPDPKTVPNANTDPNSGTKPGSDQDPDVNPDPNSEPDPNSNSASDPDPEPQSTPQPPRIPSYTPPTATNPSTAGSAPVRITGNEDETATDEEAVEPVDVAEFLADAAAIDSALAQALADYQGVVATFDFNDETTTDLTGSPRELVEADFTNQEPIEEEKSGMTVVTYQYYTEEDTEQANPEASLVFFYRENTLTAVSIVDINPIVTTALDTAASQSLSLPGTAGQDVLALNPTVTSLTHKKRGGTEYDILTVPSDVDQAKLILLAVGPTRASIEGTASYNAGETDIKDVLASHIADVSAYDTSQASAEDGSEAPAEEITDDGASEEVPAEGEVAEETEEEASINLAPNVDVAPEDLKTVAELEEGYGLLRDQLNGAASLVTVDDIREALGEASKDETIGSSIFLEYYAIEEDNVIMINVQADKETGELLSLKREHRTPALNEPFPINLEELIALAQEALTIESVQSALGNPTITEYLALENTVRYVWTSFVDEEMGYIEGIYDGATGNVELFYYAPDTATATEEAPAEEDVTEENTEETTE